MDYMDYENKPVGGVTARDYLKGLHRELQVYYCGPGAIAAMAEDNDVDHITMLALIDEGQRYRRLDRELLNEED